MIEVYALTDPNSIIRYIGQSSNSLRRLWWHKSAAKRGERGRVYNWIRSVFKSGGTINRVVLEVCSEATADERESCWIRYYLDLKVDLTNCTEGGGGTRGWKHSEETKDKIGAVHKGKKVGVETRQLLSEAKRGKRLSADHRKKIRENSPHRVPSIEERAAISRRMQGNQHCFGLRRSAQDIANKCASALHGEKSPRAKTTNKLAEEMRIRFEDGMRQADIARLYNIDTVTVHRIVRRKTYQ